MASKQLGKLRQWAGEVISSKDKTTVSDDFKELEKDIELRRDGATRLLAASEAWKRTLSKKKRNDALDEAEKLLPIDALGIVMIVHGEEFGDDSAFGSCLAKLGRAHCKIATLQEVFALSFNDTFVVSMEKFLEEFKEYDANRKKLDSRRLSYDAAFAKFEKVKGSKKEKERKDAEEEMDRSKERYEETSDEIQAQMHAIQEREIDLLRDLTAALDIEINYVEQYLNVLQDVKAEWNESSISHKRPPTSNGTAHNFSRSRSSVYSINSYHSAVDASDDGHAPSVSSHRPSVLVRARTSSSASKPPSRPASRTSTRKRSESTGTTAEKEEQEKASRRLSVADWASDAFGSVTGRSKKAKDKERFTTLSDDEGFRDGNEDANGSPTKQRTSAFRISRRSSTSKDTPQSAGTSPKPGSKILKPLSLQDRKVARAVKSFRGSSDELTFDAGDEISVVNETLDDWWMGELNGRRGLFPTSHVEVMMVKPSIPMRPWSRNSKNKTSTVSSPADDPQRRTLTDDTSSILSTDADLDETDFARPPLSAHHAHVPFYGGPAADVISISDSMAEDDNASFSGSKGIPTSFDDDFAPSTSFPATSISGSSTHSLSGPPPLPRRTTDTSKKAPPPPPPRRSAAQNLRAPPIPARPSYQSSKSSIKSTSSMSSIDQDRSPFESVSDFDVPPNTAKGCMNFKQSQFQAPGMCANCSQYHG